MIQLQTHSFIEAHHLTVKKLFHESHPSSDPELLCESFITLEISQFPEPGDWLRDKSVLEEATKHLHPTDKIAERIRDHYSERMTDQKIHDVIQLLKRRPYSKKAVIQVWEDGDLDRERNSACIMYIWFRRNENALNCHTHIRASDVFKKLLANLLIVSRIHIDIAKQLGLEVGIMRFVSDCGHLYKEDLGAIETFLNQ